jgi:beta-aspartyl-peptidase (threonine type)
MKPIFQLNLVRMAVAAAVLSFCAPVITSGQEGEKKISRKEEIKAGAAIRKVLDDQLAAWNRGDIEGFMEGYWRSQATVFISGDSVTYGWQTVLDRYKKGYNTREKMGTLEFQSLDFKFFNKEAAVVHGSWVLARARDKPHGRFTLIFRKTAQGWRIVHDHTSSA